MTKAEFLERIGDAYPGSFPADREQALEHSLGDTLADFIFLELDENLSDDVVNLIDALHVINGVKNDVNAVVREIERIFMKEEED
jgi:hypothetical protein